MARDGVDGFQNVVVWALDEVARAPKVLQALTGVLIQSRLLEWVSTGELDDTPLLTRMEDIVAPDDID